MHVLLNLISNPVSTRNKCAKKILPNNNYLSPNELKELIFYSTVILVTII